MHQTSADTQDNLMLKKHVPIRNKIIEAQTPVNPQQSVEYN